MFSTVGFPANVMTASWVVAGEMSIESVISMRNPFSSLNWSSWMLFVLSAISARSATHVEAVEKKEEDT